MRRIVPIMVSIIMIVPILMVMNMIADDTEGLLIDENSLIERDIILIEGNDDFTSENGVISGTGTSSDPYIIENWDIEAIEGHGIHVMDTSAYFLIRNCQVRNGREDDVHRYNSGVYLKNVENCSIENCEFVGNSNGIYGYKSSNLMINNNSCLRNSNGIHLSEDGNDYQIHNNTCNYNGYGIVLRGSFHNGRISNNTCMRNRHTGLSLERDCRDFMVENNICSSNFDVDEPNHENGRGIGIMGGLRITLRSNNCSDNSGYGITMSGEYGKIINNTAHDNLGLDKNMTGYGIFVEFATGHILKDNSIKNCMVGIWGRELKHWLTISMDNSNNINGKPFLFVKNRTTPTVWSGGYG